MVVVTNLGASSTVVERPQKCPQQCPQPWSAPCRRVSGPGLDALHARAVQAGGAEVPTCRRRALTARTDAVDTMDQAGIRPAYLQHFLFI